MQKTILKTLLSLGLLAFAFSANAKWYTSNGIGTTRDEAVNDALENIMMQSGADVKLLQVYKNGALQSEDFQLRAQNPVKKIEVVEMQTTLNKVSVTLKAFIDDEKLKKRCAVSSLPKTMVPISFKFADSKSYQSSIGIEDINIEINKIIYNKLGSSRAFALRNLVNANLTNAQNRNVNAKYQADNIRAVANQANAQYIMLGTINSVATSEVGNNVLTKLVFNNTRSIDFDIDIYDAVNQTQVFHQNYTAETDWPFKQSDRIDLRSDRFKSSDYGQRLYDLCSRAVKDIIYALECQNVTARVIDLDEDDLIINLGNDSNLKEGQIFTLIQHSIRNGDLGDEYESYDKTSSKYKVIRVYPRTARLHPINMHQNTLNIKANDLVTIQ